MLELVLVGVAVVAAGTLMVTVVIAVRLGGVLAQKPLTREEVASICRDESDRARAAEDDRARHLRHELAEHLKGLQETTTTAFGALSAGVNGQVRGFGENLDKGVKIIETKV